MKLIDTDETVLIVVGSDIPAEMNDRPTAYALKREIDRKGRGIAFRTAVVVSDRWYADNRIFPLGPTIAVGGPGGNGVAAALVDELPMKVQRDERVFVQGSWDGETRRASLWGADRSATARAVELFVADGLCGDFLARIWKDAGARVDLA